MNKKKIILTLILVIAIISLIFTTYRLLFPKKTEMEKSKVIDQIENYNYSLSENETSLYKSYFNDLKDVLSNQNVDELEYAKIVTKIFITDFYDLNSKVTKNDVGGTQFVHSKIRDNFVLNAKDTIYKYVENNLYGDRKQELPSVVDISIADIKETTYKYNNKNVKAYQVSANWTYDKDLDYQKSATITLINEGNKLSIVELK